MKSKINFPEFEGKPYGFLKDDFGKIFVREYQKRADLDYKKNSVLRALIYDEGVVKGSNSFAVVLANQILREEELRTATQADLEKILKAKALGLSGIYVDTGLVLRNEKDEYSLNNPLVKYLAEQLGEREIEFSPVNPAVIPLTGLELENEDNGYGLTFKLREDAEIYIVPILAEDGKFISKDIDGKTGLPKKLRDSGERNFLTRNSGLSRLNMLNNSDLGSYNSDLRYSGCSGRIVVVNDGKKRKNE